MSEELEQGHFQGDGHTHGADEEDTEADFIRPPMGERTPDLDLTADEQDEVKRIAEEKGISEGAAELLFRNGDL